jgi:hypothetical protein
MMKMNNVSEWMELMELNCDRVKSEKKPESWRRDLEREEMTVVASSHMHHSSHPLAHSLT